MARRAALALLAVPAMLFAPPCRAQQAATCPVAVAFEPLAVRSAVGVANQYHAVVLIGGDAYEGNPSGQFPAWGHLVGRRRDLARHQLKEGALQRSAGQRPQPCAQVLAAAEATTRRLNAARLPYAPAPELAWGSVNSNSYAHYLVRKLGLAPPPAPFPPAYGFVPGYHAAITD